MKYVQPIGGLADAPYVDANPAGGVEGSPVPAAAIEHPMREIVAVIQAAGIVPSELALTQLLLALRSAGVFQTAAQFDDSTKAATTGFLRRALGSLSGVTPLNAAAVLTAAHAGNLISLYGAGGFSVTLPLGATVPVGTTIQFFCVSTPGNVALIRQGADVISVASSTVTGLTLNAGSSVTMVWNGVAWTAWGESQLPFSPLFAASLAPSGHQKLPSGKIIQWGRATVATNGSVITLPIAFPNAHLRTFANYGDCQPAGTPDARAGTAWCGQRTLTNFVGKYQASDGVNTGTSLFDWFAIGY